MPIGFAKQIFAQGTTTAGTNFTGWDGSNDTTFTTTTTTKHFIGFAPFNNEYGVLISAKDNGSDDQIQYDVIRNQSGTLSITDGGNTFINTGVADYLDLRGLVAPTQDGAVICEVEASASTIYHRFTISSGTVTRSDGKTTARNRYSYPLFVNRTGETTGYNNINYGKAAQKITSTDHFASNETVTNHLDSTGYHYGDGRSLPGFVDKDTVFWLNSQTSGQKLQPHKLDLTDTNVQSFTAFSGSPTNSTTMAQFDTANSTNFGTNTYDFDTHATPAYNETGFNDIALLMRRETTGGANKLVMESYKAGDSSVQRSNIVTLSTGSTAGDSSGTGCFVGATNDTFLFAGADITNNRVWVCKFQQSTNTLTEILNFSETLPTATGAEEVRLHRWFNQGALMTIGNTKIRFIQT